MTRRLEYFVRSGNVESAFYIITNVNEPKNANKEDVAEVGLERMGFVNKNT